MEDGLQSHAKAALQAHHISLLFQKSGISVNTETYLGLACLIPARRGIGTHVYPCLFGTSSEELAIFHNHTQLHCIRAMEPSRATNIVFISSGRDSYRQIPPSTL